MVYLDAVGAPGVPRVHGRGRQRVSGIVITIVLPAAKSDLARRDLRRLAVARPSAALVCPDGAQQTQHGHGPGDVDDDDVGAVQGVVYEPRVDVRVAGADRGHAVPPLQRAPRYRKVVHVPVSAGCAALVQPVEVGEDRREGIRPLHAPTATRRIERHPEGEQRFERRNEARVAYTVGIYKRVRQRRRVQRLREGVHGRQVRDRGPVRAGGGGVRRKHLEGDLRGYIVPCAVHRLFDVPVQDVRAPGCREHHVAHVLAPSIRGR